MMDSRLLALAALGGAYWYLKGRKQRNPQRPSLRRNPTREELLAQQKALYDRLNELYEGPNYFAGAGATNKWMTSKQSAIKRTRAKLHSVQRKLGLPSGADIDNLSGSTQAGRYRHKKRFGYYP